MPRPHLLVLAALGLGPLTGGPLAAQRLTHPSAAIYRRIPSSGHPYGVTIDRTGIVYVSQVNAGQLVRVPFDATSEPQVTDIGSQPPHVVVEPDGRSVFATLQGGRAVVRIDTESGRTIDSVPLGSDGFNLALDPDGVHLVATAAAGWAYRLTRSPLRILDSAWVGLAPNGVTFDGPAHRVYVSSRDSGSVTALDSRDLTPVTRWAVGGAPQRIALSRTGKFLFVADESAGGGIKRIDTRSGAIRSVPMEGTPYGLGVTPDGTRLWVLLRDRGTVQVLRLPDLTPVTEVQVGGRPRNIAFNRRGDRAAITTETAVVLLR